MTEPAQAEGSDPEQVQTTAERDGDEYVITGHKWRTTQGSEADLLVVARTDWEAHPYVGCSLFLVPADTVGVEIQRDVPHMGLSHAEVTYDGVRVPEENMLGAENTGLTVAQQRLGPARLTHCMRVIGMADWALDAAKAYMSERTAFGDPLVDKQALRFDISDAEMRLHAARTMACHAARTLAADGEARVEVAMSELFAVETTQEIIDTCVQVCGGNGIGKDLPLADFYRRSRPSASGSHGNRRFPR